MSQKASPVQSTNLWTGIATIVAGLFSYFALTPDWAVADTIAEESRRAVEAVQTKNYVALFTVVVSLGNIVYHLFFKKRTA